jgi:uncharacterized membrane protein
MNLEVPEMLCPSCNQEIASSASFCPHCGANLSGAASPPPVPPYQPGIQSPGQSGLSDNLAGALAYVTIVPAILFLVLDPYKRSSFVRFHCFQSIFLFIASVVLHFATFHIPYIGWIFGLLISLAIFAVWILVLVKASQGQRFKLPLIGDLAEQQARTA